MAATRSNVPKTSAPNTALRAKLLSLLPWAPSLYLDALQSHILEENRTENRCDQKTVRLLFVDLKSSRDSTIARAGLSAIGAFQPRSVYQHWAVEVDGWCYEVIINRNGNAPTSSASMTNIARSVSRSSAQPEHMMMSLSLDQWCRSKHSPSEKVRVKAVNMGQTRLRTGDIDALAQSIWNTWTASHGDGRQYSLRRRNCQDFAVNLIDQIQKKEMHVSRWPVPELFSQTILARKPKRVVMGSALVLAIKIGILAAL